MEAAVITRLRTTLKEPEATSFLTEVWQLFGYISDSTGSQQEEIEKLALKLWERTKKTNSSDEK